MARDPKYLRLADRIAVHGCRHDLNSGFGISGFDVVEFPDAEENPAAVKFARNMLRKGVFEEAGKAEFDEIRESDPEVGEDLQRIVMVKPGQVIQEHVLRQNIQKAGVKVAKRAQARLEETEYDEDDDEDDITLAGDAQRPTPKERRKALRAAEGKSTKKSRTREDNSAETTTTA